MEAYLIHDHHKFLYVKTIKMNDQFKHVVSSAIYKIVYK